MDIQLIGNAYGAAEYAGAYVSKAEPDTVRFKKVIAAAVKRCDANLPHHAFLKRVANAALSIREVSAQEAYYILLRELPLHEKSRTVTRVKVLRHPLRCYRVERSELRNLARLASVEKPIIRIEPMERAYAARPECNPFHTMSFAAFVEEYDLVENKSSLGPKQSYWKRCDGEGYIKKRRKPQVIRMSPWIAPDVKNPNFCYAELFLHIPWRSLDELPQTDEDCIASFVDAQERSLDSELLVESNAKIARQHNLELLKPSNTVHVLQHLPPSEYVFVDESVNIPARPSCIEGSSPESNFLINWNTKHAYTPEDVVRAREFVKSSVRPCMKEKKNISRLHSIKNYSYRYPVDMNNGNSHGMMAESQLMPFALAMQQSRARLKSTLESTECEPLQLIISGEGASGKSWLIDHIVKDVQYVLSENSVQNSTQRVFLLAQQRTAAFNIKGQTLCSALGFASFSRSTFSVPYTSLTAQKNGPEKLNKLQQRFKDVHLVVIDEFSVISCGMLSWIDERMKEIWPSCHHQRFGGRDIIFTGDSGQLDPVVPYSLSTPMHKINNDVHRKGRVIWEGIGFVCTLTSQNRGILDPEWFDALRRLRRRQPTRTDVELFNSRCSISNLFPEEFAAAKHIAHTNVDVEAANQKCLQTNTAPIVRIKAQHHVQQKRLHRQRDIPAGTVQTLVTEAKVANSDRDRVVGTELKLCVGAPVTLTYNLEQSAGLCNGTNGVVYDFMFVSDSELPIVLIQITDMYLGPSFLKDVPNIIPIPPKDISWGKKNSDFRVIRRGIPLRLAYAMTVHIVQGLTPPDRMLHNAA